MSNANFPFEEPQVQSLIEHARGFNNSKNITGCLLYYNGIFIQYLEGDQANVLALFDGIKKDNRHSQVTLLSSSDINEREFETWNMAYENFIGSSHQLEYLKFMISLFKEPTNTVIKPNVTSKKFWAAVKKLLKS